MPIEVANIKLYSVKDLSQELHVTNLSIRSYLKNGKLKGQKIGGRWYVAEENLHSFLKGE